MSGRIHRKLDVWKRSVQLTRRIQQISKRFPPEIRFGISSHVIKTAFSIASNIAEGAARKNKGEKLQFFNIAQGSLSEIDTQVEILWEMSLIKRSEYFDLIEDIEVISRKLYNLTRWVKKRTLYE